MFFQNVIAVFSVVLIVLVSIFFLYRHIVLRPKQKAYLIYKLSCEEFNTEMDRIEALPKLNTRWLMRVSERVIKNDNSPKRFYGTRFNRMLVFDERGDAWVGLAVPEVLESLKAGEYILGDYYIPFRGGGEAFSGERVTVDGQRIDIYPSWMTGGVNMPDWNLWAQIEKNFRETWHTGNYQHALGKLSEHMDEFREKRNELNRLAVIVKIKV